METFRCAVARYSLRDGIRRGRLCHRIAAARCKINAPTEIIGGIGGLTPIYHAIECGVDGDDGALRVLLKALRNQPLFGRVDLRVDFSVRAMWRRFDEVASEPMTPIGFAEHLAKMAEPHQRSNVMLC